MIKDWATVTDVVVVVGRDGARDGDLYFGSSVCVCVCVWCVVCV